MEWYYARDGKQQGPVDDDALAQLLTRGELTPDTLVWNESMTEWQPYQAVLTPAPPPSPSHAIATQSEPPPATDALLSDSASCLQCEQAHPISEMIPYQEGYVCGGCKETFFQRIQEGAGPLIGGGGTGLTPNARIMAGARAALAGRWGLAIGFILLMYLVIMGLAMIPFIGIIVYLICLPALIVSGAKFLTALVRRRDDARVGMLFCCFDRFGTALGAMALTTLFILLWCLPLYATMGLLVPLLAGDRELLVVLLVLLSVLFYIPALRAMCTYAMTPFIVADNPHIGPLTAVRQSKQMMQGSRWKFFCLYFRFIGWMLLAMLTLGIGLLWVYPYMFVSMAGFYEDVRGKAA